MRRSLFALLLLTSSCGGGENASQSANDASTSNDAQPTVDAETDAFLVADASDVMMDAELYGPYPAGPYGNKVGDALPDLKWQGFVNPTSDALSTTKPFVSTSLDALRRSARKPYALIHVSEFY